MKQNYPKSTLFTKMILSICLCIRVGNPGEPAYLFLEIPGLAQKISRSRKCFVFSKLIEV